MPCPHCGQKNNFLDLADAEQGGTATSWGSQLERGAVVDCDHCGKKSKIFAIQTMTILRLVPM